MCPVQTVTYVSGRSKDLTRVSELKKLSSSALRKLETHTDFLGPLKPIFALLEQFCVALQIQIHTDGEVRIPWKGILMRKAK